MQEIVGGMARERFVVLDGLRGVAALAVLAGHAQDFSLIYPPHFFLSVDFFFVLSGFVLAHSYGERLRTGLSAPRFMLARYIRFLSTLCAHLAALATNHST